MPDVKTLDWKTCHFSSFAHRECEFYPCHELANPEDFNCLFCYCPLYALGKNCGGNPKFLPDGTKDCVACLYPHFRKNYPEIIDRLIQTKNHFLDSES